MKEVFEKIIDQLRKEAAEEDSPIYEGDEEVGLYVDEREVEIIIKRIAAEYNNGWIPVEDKLPENGETVLAYIKHNYAEDGWRAYRVYEYDADSEHWIGMGNLCEVIAWQPLPEPWEG